jgi:hypothetical protein
MMFLRGRADDVKAGPPVKLIWDVPVETREVKVPVEFKGLSLPD